MVFGAYAGGGSGVCAFMEGVVLVLALVLGMLVEVLVLWWFVVLVVVVLVCGGGDVVEEVVVLLLFLMLFRFWYCCCDACWFAVRVFPPLLRELKYGRPLAPRHQCDTGCASLCSCKFIRMSCVSVLPVCVRA